MQQATKNICDVYVMKQYVWHKTGLRISNLEIFVNDAYFSGRPMTEKIGEIVKKIEQDWLISSVSYKLNMDHETVLNHLKKDG